MLENMNFRTHLSTYVPCILFIITWLPTSGSLQIIAIGLLILVAALFVLLRAADISWIDLAILGGIFAFTIANAVLAVT